MFEQSEPYQSSHSYEPNESGNHKTARPTDHEPEQGAKNLTAVERVNRKHIESQQENVDARQGSYESVNIRHRIFPPELLRRKKRDQR